MEAGTWTLVWDLRTDAGTWAASGAYFLRLGHEGGALTRRLVVIR